MNRSLTMHLSEAVIKGFSTRWACWCWTIGKEVYDPELKNGDYIQWINPIMAEYREMKDIPASRPLPMDFDNWLISKTVDTLEANRG